MNTRKTASTLFTILTATLSIAATAIVLINSLTVLHLAAAIGKDQCGLGSGQSTQAQESRPSGLDTAAAAHDEGGIGHRLGPAASGTCSSH
jgi:hypothetical protein